VQHRERHALDLQGLRMPDKENFRYRTLDLHRTALLASKYQPVFVGARHHPEPVAIKIQGLQARHPLEYR
jgi:hypothetical protein